MFNGALMIRERIRKREAEPEDCKNCCKSGDITEGVKEQLR
jgi:hypothetical protein